MTRRRVLLFVFTRTMLKHLETGIANTPVSIQDSEDEDKETSSEMAASSDLLYN